ncbi:MAG TPA: ankyrin repeat domain-containing protein [Bryobacteraceae bacterium]|jgi:ankyrin repeat protein|nr:ankyrin repeat domain-containing protein [Bryobacteraceae bacterium]
MADLNSFHDAVKQGNLEAVRAALEGHPSLLNQTNASGQTAFLLAKYYRQPAIAEYLLSLGPKLDLFQNCAAGRTEAALEEVDRDLKLLESHSPDGWTPLHLAAFFGHAELVKALLNRGAGIDARSTNAMQNTPLHAAAAGADLGTMELLLTQGADPNARQHGGWTALHAAAQTGNRAMAELLLAHGAHRHVQADNNQSPLDMALSYGRSELVALLES